MARKFKSTHVVTRKGSRKFQISGGPGGPFQAKFPRCLNYSTIINGDLLKGDFGLVRHERDNSDFKVF